MNIVQLTGERAMLHRVSGRVFTAKALIRVIYAVLSLHAIGVAQAQTQTQTRYQAPPQNYWHNNWTSNGD